MSVDDEVSAVSETSLPVVDKDNTEKSMTGIGSDVKIDPDGSFDSQCSLYSERSKKRRYKGKKEKKPGITGRTWKKVEDPHAPRKPRSGYVHFLSSRRSRYGTVKQGCDQKTINVALAAEWQSLSEDERRPFIELANKEREQYQIEMKAYEQTDHYREFIEKKERIMKLRKQRRRLGMDSQDEFDESLEFDDTFPEDVKKKIKIENTDKHIIELDEVVNPTLPNTAIPIFSQEFLEYNKNREAKLRSLRREISVAEAEKAAIQRTIEKMQENNIAYESQAAYDKKMAKEADRIIECWMRVLRAAMSETMKEYHLNTPEETVEFLTKLADGDAPNEDVLQVVKEVIHSASFLLQK